MATFKQLSLAMVTIASMLALAYVMNYSGMTSTLGLALATSGVAFPFFSATLGWLGVFLTGSDTSANALFGNLQVVTANALNLNPVLTASVNSAAGVMGKMISVQSIAVAVAATGMTRADESRLFRVHDQAQRVPDGASWASSRCSSHTSSPAAYPSCHPNRRDRSHGGTNALPKLGPSIRGPAHDARPRAVRGRVPGWLR